MPDLLLRPVAATDITALWVDALAQRLQDELAVALRGQCLRVVDVPRQILEGVAERLSTERRHDAEIYLVDRQAGPEPWRVGVHRVVERRNADVTLLALFPPELQLAAGDSVDVSTFRAIAVNDLPGRIVQSLKRRLPERLLGHANAVLGDLKQRGWPIPESAPLAFLATIIAQGQDDPAVVGGSLYTLGLIPDFALLARPEELHYRLGQRNIQAVRRLRDEIGTPTERVLRLPLADRRFCERLLALFAAQPIADVHAWGRAIATDPVWRDLSLDRWPLIEMPRPASALRIDIEPLKLPRRREDGLPLFDGPKSEVKIGWQTTPPPMDVDDLAHFRIEVVNSDRQVVWETPLIKNTGGKTAKRQRSIKRLDLDTGIYFFRVIALDKAGDPFPAQPLRDQAAGATAMEAADLGSEGGGDEAPGKRINESEDFLLLADENDEPDEDVEPVTNTQVGSFAEAELLYRASGAPMRKDSTASRAAVIAWTTTPDARGEAAVATIRFDLQHQYSARISQRLRAIEASILQRPENGGHFAARVPPSGGDRAFVERDVLLPDDVLEARRAVLDGIAGPRLANEPALGTLPVVALADLLAIRPLIEQYVAAYRRWVDGGDPAALRLDVTLLTMHDLGTAALVAPTHPLRLLWLLQKQQLVRHWTSQAAQRPGTPRSYIELWRRALVPDALPLLVVLDASEGYVDAGSLPGGWGVYLPPALRDPRLLLGAIRARFGASGLQPAEDGAHLLAEKWALFLRQHPYVEALTINVVNPGDAAIIRDALIDLERRAAPGDVRYVVRLFTAGPHDAGVGDAFRELLDPESQIATVADRLIRPGPSFLYPKLSWSRHALHDFVAQPERFPAHITVLLDAFPLRLRVARMEPRDRTSFVHGLVQDVPRRFLGRGRSYAWGRRLMPKRCLDLPETPGMSETLAGALLGLSILQARALAPQSDTVDAVAAPLLDLSTPVADSATDGHSLLYSAHAASTWVLTMDANLGLDYFDAAHQAGRPGYLLDFTPEFVASGSRQLLLTTRVSDEIDALMAQPISDLGLAGAHGAALLLMEALRSLSGRLVLRLLSAPSQAKGALGMALARLFLESYGLLESSLVIPLDAHPELSHDADGEGPHLRGDLLLVAADVATRSLDFLVVETKCYGGSGISADLRASIAAQLGSSERALRLAFDPHAEDPDRLDRSVQSWRLSTVLTFYLDRALRYTLVAPEVAAALHSFFLDLDEHYQLTVRKIGLVFHPEGMDTFLDRDDPDVPIWAVGRQEIQRLVGAALEKARADAAAESPVAERERALETQEGLAEATVDAATRDAVRRTFSNPTIQRPSLQRRLPLREHVAARDGDDAATMQRQSDLHAPEGAESSPAFAGGSTETPATPPAGHLNGGDESAEGLVETTTGNRQEVAGIKPEPPLDTPPPSYAVLLGDTKATPQYGLLGAIAAEPQRRVALDLNGCNTISVFGVQGSGKSYTVGAVLEMALRRLPGLNSLPHALAGVVFHYHQTQDYPPEFISMAAANDDPGQVAALGAWGAAPAALDDILVLTTRDMVEARRRDFPRATVAPIAFSSGELTVADWRFLMGATGNDSLYLKILNEIMRKRRDDLTLAAIQVSLAAAPLADSQRVLAQTRLDFAARFIDDAGSLRSLVRPGRLIIVDLRDEFVEREQALGLFVTMLNVFAGAGQGSTPFNKLIVFDEAHKYMGGAFIDQVVETIREMRHKGVSLLIASQDPVHVPQAVIELSSAVILHRFNSPAWLKHLQKSLATLGDLTPSMLAALGPGDAFLWANKATDAAFMRRAVKVRMRPRATLHGGATQKAVRTQG